MVTDIELLRSWAAARAKGMDCTDTEINFFQDHLLGEDETCQYGCCDRGDGSQHFTRREYEFDLALQHVVELPEVLEPLELELRESMSRDLDEWKEEQRSLTHKGKKDKATS